MIPRRSRGRGGDYRPWRGIVEAVLERAYVGDWPARLWSAVPGACEVRRTELAFAVGERSPGIGRIAFASDLHLGPTTPRRLLEAAFDALAAAAPDVLLLGGDFVFLESTAAKMRDLGALLRRVPRARAFAVLGNHDLWSSHERLESALEGEGVRVLVNANVALGPGLSLVGVDDPWTGSPDVARAFDGVSPADAVVLLCHSPDALPAARAAIASRGAPALYLCGHTHGGQIAMPWGPLYVPGPVGRVHPSGLYDLDDLRLYVSRGVGTTELPIRTFAAPEIVVVDVC